MATRIYSIADVENLGYRGTPIKDRRYSKAELGRAHPHNVGRPNAAKHLDDALGYIRGHDGIWATTTDDIAEYYLANYYDQVKSWIADRKAQTKT